MTEALRSFIAQNTREAAPPLCPELRLHLATGAIELWERTESLVGRTGLPPPFWAFAWPGGQALARFLLDAPETVRGRSVLDFASGGGVQAVAAAKAGAASVLATEIDPFSVETIALNAQLNGVDVTVTGEDVIDRDEGWQVVLAGDVCYERPMAERVMAWLRRLSARGALVLVGDPGRNYLPSAGMAERARYAVPTTLDLEDRLVRDTAVWQVMA